MESQNRPLAYKQAFVIPMDELTKVSGGSEQVAIKQTMKDTVIYPSGVDMLWDIAGE